MPEVMACSPIGLPIACPVTGSQIRMEVMLREYSWRPSSLNATSCMIFVTRQWLPHPARFASPIAGPSCRRSPKKAPAPSG